MTVYPGYKFVEIFSGGITWYIMQAKDIISSICFKLRNENGILVSFNGQSVTFRLSIKRILRDGYIHFYEIRVPSKY